MGHRSGPTSTRSELVLALGALGVVFGDIGTSPLYAFRECFTHNAALDATPSNVLGVLSIVFWSLVLIVSIKYLVFVLRADNRGEGGVLALMALAHPERRTTLGMVREDRRQMASLRRRVFVLLGLFGAALLYGDGMLTPTVSVLSAIEGLKVATPVFEPFVLPITIIILILIFTFQRIGTARIGAVFGPIILTWFLTMALLGARWLVRYPEVLHALHPAHAVAFFRDNGFEAFRSMGAIFLVVTGSEAMYADMGHFGRGPIRIGWFWLAFPALLFNYFGQGALLLADPAAIENPFFHLPPRWALYPVITLATVSTVIASQAVISGAFSLTRQAVQFGYLPRMDIQHTSSEEIGQIYVPFVNWALLVSTIWLVLEFRSSSNLAAAYGIAVSTTMVITTLLLYAVQRHLWKWPLVLALGFLALFIATDLTFFGANLLKIWQGGWFPLVVGASVFTAMSTWRRGRQILAERLQTRSIPIDAFLKELEANPPVRIPGTAVFMTGQDRGTPPSLAHNVRLNRVLHEQVLIMRVTTEDVPRVSVEERLEMESIGQGIHRVTVHYGFKDTPNVPGVLHLLRARGMENINPADVTYYLGRETLLATHRPGMAIWRDKLFAFMAANAQRATTFFKLPPNQVIEIGMQVEL